MWDKQSFTQMCCFYCVQVVPSVRWWLSWARMAQQTTRTAGTGEYMLRTCCQLLRTFVLTTCKCCLCVCRQRAYIQPTPATHCAPRSPQPQAHASPGWGSAPHPKCDTQQLKGGGNGGRGCTWTVWLAFSCMHALLQLIDSPTLPFPPPRSHSLGARMRVSGSGAYQSLPCLKTCFLTSPVVPLARPNSLESC